MSIFTEAGDLIHDDIIQPVENFYENKILPIFEKVEPEVEAALLSVEQVGEKYFEQFAAGIGADALAKAVDLVNTAENVNSLGDVVQFATTIGNELVNDVEDAGKSDIQAAVTASKNIVLNAARTVLTAAVVASAQTASAQVAAGSTVAVVAPTAEQAAAATAAAGTGTNA